MIRVKLMNEYGVDFPLWIDGFSEGEAPFSDLPEAVRERLRAWARGFDENFNAFEGWASTASREAHVREARTLLSIVRDALGPDADVTLDLWEA
jgi:L-alanine-DL-glutamate epimerase-like enolase superfamily enzyme